MESIDALAKAVNEFDGGMVLVSHDMRLISQVANEIWICDDKTITKYKGDIQNFKMDMRAQMGIGEEASKLRGDASVKATDKPAKAKPEPKKQAKLEVVAPKPALTEIKEEPKPTPPPAEPKPAVTPEPEKPPADDSTATTSTSATTTASSSTDSTKSSGLAGAFGGSGPKRYIPPHLRRKMAK
uniref:ABC transporter domain-containing protein n=1 Tax=Craspedostauros australis TaxID=1486917 RepID=A0A7R9WZT2_9STRA|mmetsp:Transcript_5327/g.14402  ORF Transcript_5327/g.14402 Transcript_5327/m.14402 type:complete len:184 (+) Transcript_5327:346-897(+)